LALPLSRVIRAEPTRTKYKPTVADTLSVEAFRLRLEALGSVAVNTAECPMANLGRMLAAAPACGCGGA
jgi:hypothetical protein